MTTKGLSKLKEVQEQALALDVNKTATFDFSDNDYKFSHDGGSFIFTKGRKDYAVSENAVKALLHTVELPVALQTKLIEYPDILAYNVNELLNRKSGASKALIRSGVVVGFTEPDSIIIPNAQVLDVLDKKFKDMRFDRFSVTPQGTTHYSAVLASQDKMSVGKGDYFQGGVHIINNPMQGNSTQIEGYLTRLACLNGQIATDTVWRAPRVLDTPTPQWLYTSIKHGINVGTKLFTNIKKLKEYKIEGDKSDFLEGIYHELRIPSKIQEKITRRVISEGVDNMYDMLNHITYVASNYASVVENAALSTRLMRSGGHLAGHVREICETCNRPRISLN